MTKTVVMYQAMVETAKLFLQHGVAVTVALVELRVKAPDFSAAPTASNPSVTFHVLPSCAPPAGPGSDDATPPKHHALQMFHHLGATNVPLREFLRSRPAAAGTLIIDMFCVVDALDVAAELKLPAYFFYAGDLAVFLISQPPDRASQHGHEFREFRDSVLSLPGSGRCSVQSFGSLSGSSNLADSHGSAVIRMFHAAIRILG